MGKVFIVTKNFEIENEFITDCFIVHAMWGGNNKSPLLIMFAFSYYRAPELIFGATDYTTSIGEVVVVVREWLCFHVGATNILGFFLKNNLTLEFCRCMVSWNSARGTSFGTANLSR